MRRFFAATVTCCLVLLLGCPLAGYAAFFTASEISDLKDTPLPSDRSVTIGKLFDTYQYCQDGKWTLHETDRGQKYVEFRGKYSNLSLVLSRIKPHFWGTPDSGFKEIARSLDSAGFTVELVAQFMIAADGKSYQTAFLGFDYRGETPRVSSATMERGFRQIHQNEHFTETLPNAGIKSFDYYFKKYILSRADKKALQVVGVLPSNRDISVTWEKMPIVIYQIDGFKFDDRTECITLSARGEITDLVPEKTSNANYYAQGKVSYEKFSQDGAKYGILQNVSFELASVIKDNELRLADFRFVTSDKSSDGSEVQLVLKSLSPINFTIQTIWYNGALSEQVQVFIQRQYDAMNAAKQAELERVQAQRQADEQFRQSVLARRDTPYIGPATRKKEQQTIFGTYVYQQEGFTGQLILSPTNPSTKRMPIAISTVNPDSGNMCEFEGTCSAQGGKLICTNDDIKMDRSNFIEVTPLQNALEITHSYDLICGMGVIVEGNYTKK